MGKIDKEKLLKELPCVDTPCIGKLCKHFVLTENISKCIINKIKNFPEEPEQPIDFDSLYNEFFKKECDNKNCSNCKYNRTGNGQDSCFAQFLKSKNLTAPQIDMDQLRNEIYSEIVKNKEPKPFEVPVKKTWTLKSTTSEFIKDFNVNTHWLEHLQEPPENLKKYYNQHKEPDYSKIPVGAKVFIDDGVGMYQGVVTENEKRCIKLSYALGKSFFYNSGYDSINKIEVLKLPELAKE